MCVSVKGNFLRKPASQSGQSVFHLNTRGSVGLWQATLCFVKKTFPVRIL